MKRELLRMDHVNLEAGGERLLDNLNFQIFAGEIMGLVSRSFKGHDQLIGLIGYNRPEERNYVQPLQPFDSIVFDVEQLTAWGEYYILNRPMVTNQACIHTLLQPSLEIKGSVRNINS